MPPSSLLRLAKKKCIANIQGINDVGGQPYEQVRDVLLQVQNPEQLRRIEENSPQIQGQTGEIWLRYIQRDVQNYDLWFFPPAEAKNWSRTYQTLKKNADADLARSEEKLSREMKALARERAKKTSQLVPLAELPRLPTKRGRANAVVGVGKEMRKVMGQVKKEIAVRREHRSRIVPRDPSVFHVARGKGAQPVVSQSRAECAAEEAAGGEESKSYDQAVMKVKSEKEEKDARRERALKAAEVARTGASRPTPVLSRPPTSPRPAIPAAAAGTKRDHTGAAVRTPRPPTAPPAPRKRSRAPTPPRPAASPSSPPRGRLRKPAPATRAGISLARSKAA
ncbi:MAG: hypothetical protein M1832_001497 [Thelocarpon impressellum]|nr:MAG: hypothetical protein M1832_001497 [Thelocarpon impressellum]